MPFKQTATGAVIEKDPGAKIDYTLRWTRWLVAGDTITGATVDAPDLVVTHEFNDTDVILWVQGGLAGQSYPVHVTVTTAQGRIDPRTFHVAIKNA